MHEHFDLSFSTGQLVAGDGTQVFFLRIPVVLNPVNLFGFIGFPILGMNWLGSDIVNQNLLD